MNEEQLGWFCHDRYGATIHWGLYSLLAGEWQGRRAPGTAEWIMQTAQIPFARYRELTRRFDAPAFDADEWMKKVSAYGCRYVCFTAKHHDGFAMYDSRVSDYSVMHTPLGRDVLLELSEAARKYGLRFCVYYSQMQDWSEKDACGNTWDWQDGYRDFAQYFYGKVIPQVTELLTRYGQISMIWFDTPYDMPFTLCRELRDTVKKLQPDCLINGRIGYGLGDYRQMTDNCIPTQKYAGAWETPVTLNDTWGYSKFDHHWKNPETVLWKLADIVSRGGNLLLNIGPDGNGIFPEEGDRVMRQTGKWLKRNGESIFGASACIDMVYQNPWGPCTMKKGHLYLHVIHYPEETGKLRLFNLKIHVREITLLADHQQLRYQQSYEPARNEDRLMIFLPHTPPDPHDVVVDIAFDGEIISVPLEMLDTMYRV